MIARETHPARSWSGRGRAVRRAPSILQRRLAPAALAAAALALVASPVPCRASTSLAASSIPARPSPGCRATRPAERGERLDRAIEVAGVDRRYVLDVPSAPDPRTPLPLLLDFHGLGHSGAGVWKVSGFRALARETPFVTAYPEGLPVRLVTPTRVFEGVGWEVQRIEGNRDLAFVSALVDRIAGEYCIDLARVWATGFSNGAFLAQLLGCTMADRIAAVAPVSGGALRDVSCEPSRPVPILIHHGRWDPIIPVGQGRAARDAWTKVDACTVDAPGPAPSPNGVAATPTAGSVPTSATAAPIATASATAESASPDPSASAGAVAGANRRAAAPLPTRAPDEDDADAREVAEAASVSCELRARCRAGSSVAYCEGDFGHWWPSGASERVRDFLFAHPMPAR